MNAPKKRLTLDLDAPLQRRLKAVAALHGVSMREYCQTAIEKELERDEAGTMEPLPFGPEAMERLTALRRRIFKGAAVPEDSVAVLREIRDERSAAQ